LRTSSHDAGGPAGLLLLFILLHLHDPPVRHVPTAGREYLRLNLWLNKTALGGGGAGGPPQPAGGQPVEVVISDVMYVPEPAAAVLQSLGLAALALLSRSRRARCARAELRPASSW
jgi:hypothetical protein